MRPVWPPMHDRPQGGIGKVAVVVGSRGLVLRGRGRRPRGAALRQAGTALILDALGHAVVKLVERAIEPRDGRRIRIAGPDVELFPILARQIGVDQVQVAVEALIDGGAGPARRRGGGGERNRAEGDNEAKFSATHGQSPSARRRWGQGKRPLTRSFNRSFSAQAGQGAMTIPSSRILAIYASGNVGSTALPVSRDAHLTLGCQSISVLARPLRRGGRAGKDDALRRGWFF